MDSIPDQPQLVDCSRAVSIVAPSGWQLGRSTNIRLIKNVNHFGQSYNAPRSNCIVEYPKGHDRPGTASTPCVLHLTMLRLAPEDTLDGPATCRVISLRSRTGTPRNRSLNSQRHRILQAITSNYPMPVILQLRSRCQTQRATALTASEGFYARQDEQRWTK